MWFSTKRLWRSESLTPIHKLYGLGWDSWFENNSPKVTKKPTWTIPSVSGFDVLDSIRHSSFSTVFHAVLWTVFSVTTRQTGLSTRWTGFVLLTSGTSFDYLFSSGKWFKDVRCNSLQSRFTSTGMWSKSHFQECHLEAFLNVCRSRFPRDQEGRKWFVLQILHRFWIFQLSVGSPNWIK
jgi:hypothetical protein